jgi:hypothetical protein
MGGVDFHGDGQLVNLGDLLYATMDEIAIERIDDGGDCQDIVHGSTPTRLAGIDSGAATADCSTAPDLARIQRVGR